VSPELGLKYEVVKEGICEEIKDGDLVRAKNKFWLDDFEEGNPTEFTALGRMEVGPFQTPTKWKLGKKMPMTKLDPPTLTDAIRGMRVNEVRRIIVPPQYAFGEYGRKVDLSYRRMQSLAVQGYMEATDIPPNATMYYEIETVWSGPAQLSGCIKPYQGDA